MNFNEIYKAKLSAIQSGSCVRPPFGCGKQGPLSFKDKISEREYQISAFCQECQDAFFKEEAEEDL